ncbi:DUF881 domain-containing protein, partial [Jiangella endophytica]|uniref:DUF881 domain-containing protein n=1 Tax=Jiangella endophytica TaxID=1623398 RepID=UPI000E352C08
MPDSTTDPSGADGVTSPAAPGGAPRHAHHRHDPQEPPETPPEAPEAPEAPSEPAEAADAAPVEPEVGERGEPRPTAPDGRDEPVAAGEPAAAPQPFVPGGGRFTPAAPSGTKRLWNAVRQRPDVGQVLVALLVALLGFGAVLQVRSDDDDALANARRDDLVQILDGLRRQADRLDDHVGELESDRRDLVSGADTEAAALEQAEQRARTTGVLAGTIPATGPGIIMTISDPDHQVNAYTMLRAVNELRVAGA